MQTNDKWKPFSWYQYVSTDVMPGKNGAAQQGH